MNILFFLAKRHSTQNSRMFIAMRVTLIQMWHVQALLLVLFVTKMFYISLGSVVSHQYSTKTSFNEGMSKAAHESGHGWASLRIACAATCSTTSGSKFALMTLKNLSFLCKRQILIASDEKRPGCNTVLRLGTLFYSKSQEAMDETGDLADRRVLKSGINKITFEKDGNTKSTGVLTGKEEQESAYFTNLDSFGRAMQILHIFNDTLSKKCFANRRNWLDYPGVSPDLGPGQNKITRPTALPFGDMVVVCGGYALKGAKKYPIQTCHSWQENFSTMQSFANLSWPRFQGESFPIENGRSFAIFGGSGTSNDQFSNYLDVYRDESFSLKNTTLPKMPWGLCIGTQTGTENVYFVSVNSSQSNIFYKISKTNLNSEALEPPPKSLNYRFSSCSLFQDQYMVIVGFSRDGSKLVRQTFNIAAQTWKIDTDQKSPRNFQGKYPNILHLLAYNQSTHVLIFNGVTNLYNIGPNNSKILPVESGGTVRDQVHISGTKPVFVKREIAENICKT